MKKILIPGAILMAALTLPVYAYHCPVDMKKIDAALEAGPELSEEELAKVRELRAEGEQLHNEGKHDESLETLHEAMKILGIEHNG